MEFLVTIACLIAFIAGLTLIVKVTPKLLFRTYDEPWFMVFAVLDIFGAMLLFGGITVSLVLLNNIGIKALDFLLLVVVFFVTGRLALFCIGNHRRGVQRLSRYATGTFCLFLSLAALYCIGIIVGIFKT
jgi:hypothetical protein